MKGPRFTQLATTLPASVPFVGPETLERTTGRPFIARLGANENVFGPSPAAVAAMQSAATEIWQYADPENHDLIQALARHYQIAPDRIMVGEGVDALLGYLVRLLVEPGDAVVTSAGAYPTFNYHVAGYGGQLHTVPYRNDAEDLEALLRRATETNAKLVYFANPDNPMGSWLDAASQNSLIQNLPDNCVLLLDEAYVEFAPDGTALPMDFSQKNVIRMRTFSKAYGMAGARVGYAIGDPQLITAFHKIRNHFAMNRVSVAGAIAALGDQTYLAETVDRVAKARTRIADIASKCGLSALPSATNFVAIDCGKDGDFARSVLKNLNELGIFTRMPFVAPQDRCIRISAAPDDDLDLFADRLPNALAAAKASTP